MPRDVTATACCAAHMPTQQYCGQVGSTDTVDVGSFERLVAHAREATKKYRADTSEANKALINFLMNKFSQGRNLTNKKYEWHYDILSPDHRDPIKVCQNAFCAVYGIKMHTITYVQRRLRDEVAIERTRPVNVNLTVDDAFGAWGMDPQYYHQQIANFCDFNAIAETEGSLVAAAYLSDYFDLSSEHQPTGKHYALFGVAGILFSHLHFPILAHNYTAQVKHIDRVDRIEVYNMYTKDDTVRGVTSEILPYSKFCKLWDDAFPKVVMRKHKSVEGKCNTCEQLVNLNATCPSRADKLIIRNYTIRHRNNIVGEKIKYYERIVEAYRSNGRILSFIFDGMSKFKTAVPALRGLNQPSATFKMHMIGCIGHADKSTRFYMAYPGVQSGSSFMIHCIHEEIRRLIDAGTRLPEKIYVQIDGGPDNTAKAVYASLEHLVAAGLCETIEIWRLPVGHTHEDIDARFGVISQAMRRRSTYTVAQYLDMIRKAFGCSPLVSVVPVVAIFDYK